MKSLRFLLKRGLPAENLPLPSLFLEYGWGESGHFKNPNVFGASMSCSIDFGTFRMFACRWRDADSVYSYE